jgi:hypothetical protein
MTTMLPAAYRVFQERVAAEMHESGFIDDLVFAYAYATDCLCVMRHAPTLVVKFHNDLRFSSVLRLRNIRNSRVCFRGRLTRAYRGQAPTDSDLHIAPHRADGFSFRGLQRRSIALQPVLQVARKTCYLKSFGAKETWPCPSIDTCGTDRRIANNNASGMVLWPDSDPR